MIRKSRTICLIKTGAGINGKVRTKPPSQATAPGPGLLSGPYLAMEGMNIMKTFDELYDEQHETIAQQAEQIARLKEDNTMLVEQCCDKTTEMGIMRQSIDNLDGEVTEQSAEITRLKEENEHYREIINKGNHTIVLTEAAQPQGGE